MENSAFVQEAPLRLWIPGTGEVDLRVRAVAKAVERYDEAFRLARHEITGDWVVLIGEQGHPVFGFGRELPRPDDVEHILGQNDMKRNGPRILKQLDEAREKAYREQTAKAEARNAELVEHFEHGFRKQGQHPTPRVFVPGRTW